MDDQQKEKQFTKGYNDGYLLSRFEPDLMKKIMQTPKPEDPRFEGMQAGQKAHARELFKENLQKSNEMTQNHKPRMK